MTASALKHLASTENLKDEWNLYWRRAKKQTSRGVDGVAPGNFAKNLLSNLEMISRELKRGTYRFQPLAAHPFPKPNGKGDRIICIPTVGDRLVQRAIGTRLRAYEDYLGIYNSASFGFLSSRPNSPKGVGAARAQALLLRQTYPFAYKSDISSFFDSIPRSELFEIIDRSIPARSLRALAKAAIACEIDCSRSDIRRRVEAAGIIRGRGVRQGMPLSPFFANLILRDFDRELISKGCRLVRYADDFIILGASHDECFQVDKFVRELLSTKRFQIPSLDEADSKTQICEPAQPVEFLGLELTLGPNGKYRLQFSEKQIELIKRKLYRLKSVSELRNEKLNVSSLGRAIDSAVAGYMSAYSEDMVDNWHRLSDILLNARTTIFSSVFAEIFGDSALRLLRPEFREFLCIDGHSAVVPETTFNAA